MLPEDYLRQHFELKALEAHEIHESASEGANYWCCVRELPGQGGHSRRCCWRSKDGNDNVKLLKGHALSQCHKDSAKPDKNGTIKLKWEVAYLEGLSDADIAKKVAPKLNKFVESKFLSSEAKSLLTSETYTRVPFLCYVAAYGHTDTLQQQNGKAALLASLVQHYRREIASKQRKQAKKAQALASPNLQQEGTSDEAYGKASLDSTPVASSSGGAVSETSSSATSPEAPPINEGHTGPVGLPAPITPTNQHTATADSLTYGFFHSYIDQTPPVYFEEPERNGQLQLLPWKDNFPFPYTTIDFPCRILASLPAPSLSQAKLAARKKSPKTWQYMQFLETYERTEVANYIPEAVFVAISALAKDISLRLQSEQIRSLLDLHAALDSYGALCYAVTWEFIGQRMIEYIWHVDQDLLEQLPSLCLRYLSWLKGGARFEVEVHTRSTEKVVQVDWYHLPGLYDEAVRRDYGYSLLAMVAWAASHGYAIQAWGWDRSELVGDWERLRYRYTLRAVRS